MDFEFKFDRLKELIDKHRFKQVYVEPRDPVFIELTSNEISRRIKENTIGFDNTMPSLWIDTPEGRHYGFIYLRDYHLDYNTLPKFHVSRCNTIQEMEEMGKAKRYVFSNERIVTVYQIRTDKIDYTERKTRVDSYTRTLELCQNCAKQVRMNSINSDVFIDRIIKPLLVYDSEASLNSDGYVANWYRISNYIRSYNNNTCQNCHIQLKNGNLKYLHTHHINGNKLDNRLENLKCLCLKCHSEVDELHKRRYQRPPASEAKANFMKIYDSLKQ